MPLSKKITCITFGKKFCLLSSIFILKIYHALSISTYDELIMERTVVALIHLLVLPRQDSSGASPHPGRASIIILTPRSGLNSNCCTLTNLLFLKDRISLKTHIFNAIAMLYAPEIVVFVNYLAWWYLEVLLGKHHRSRRCCSLRGGSYP